MADDPKPAPKPVDAPVAAQPAAVAPQASAPAQVKAPGVVPLTTPGRAQRRYAIVRDNVIQRVEMADAPPKPAAGERVVDVHTVPAFPGNVVDAVGNVSPSSVGAPASAQAVAPEVTPATVPVVAINAVPLPQNPGTGG